VTRDRCYSIGVNPTLGRASTKRVQVPLPLASVLTCKVLLTMTGVTRTHPRSGGDHRLHRPTWKNPGSACTLYADRVC